LAFIIQKFEYCQGYPVTDGSHSSPLHPRSGTAATIQFPHGTIGYTHGGFEYPAAIAGAPKQAAIPNPPVRVGVAKSLTKFVGEVAQSIPQAPRVALHTPVYCIGEIGYTAGTW